MRRSLFALVAAAALAAPRAHATAVERFGFGARSAALGSANVADVTDYSAVYYDPAALTLGKGSVVGFGYQAGDYSLTLDEEPLSPKSVSLFEGGFVARGRLFSLPVAVGVGFALPGGDLSHIETLEAGRPVWLLDELSNSVAFAGAGAALRPLPWLSLGASLGYLASVRGGFTVSGTAVQPVGTRTEYDSTLRHAVDADLTSVRYPTFALLAEPWPALRAALVYRAPALIEQRITGELGGNVDLGFLQLPVEYDFESRSVAAYLPRQLTLALSGLLEPATRVDLALAWQDLSETPSPEARTSAHVSATTPPGLTLVLPPARVAPARSSAGLADRIVPRLAVEHFVELRSRVRLALRLGASYERSALSGPSVWLDATRLGASTGAGLEWSPRALGSLRLDAQASYSHFADEAVLANFSSRHVAGGNAIGTALSLSAEFY